jgi:carboxymethylenebutenolidase
MIHESYSVDPTTSFDIDIAPAPADGKKYPVVVLVHGNFGLAAPFGRQLLDFTDEIAALGYLAALPSYYQPFQHGYSAYSMRR